MGIKDYFITKLRGVTGIIDVLEGIDLLLRDQKRESTKDLLKKIQPGAILKCRINPMPILAPIETLQVYQHCLDPLLIFMKMLKLENLLY